MKRSRNSAPFLTRSCEGETLPPAVFLLRDPEQLPQDRGQKPGGTDQYDLHGSLHSAAKRRHKYNLSFDRAVGQTWGGSILGKLVREAVYLDFDRCTFTLIPAVRVVLLPLYAGAWSRVRGVKTLCWSFPQPSFEGLSQKSFVGKEFSTFPQPCLWKTP